MNDLHKFGKFEKLLRRVTFPLSEKWPKGHLRGKGFRCPFPLKNPLSLRRPKEGVSAPSFGNQPRWVSNYQIAVAVRCTAPGYGVLWHAIFYLRISIGRNSLFPGSDIEFLRLLLCRNQQVSCRTIITICDMFQRIGNSIEQQQVHLFVIRHTMSSSRIKYSPITGDCQ